MLRVFKTEVDALAEGVPAFTASLLAAKHSHHLDKRITFVEATHTYAVQFGAEQAFETSGILSVSGLVHQFFPAFDPDACVQKVLKSKNAGTKRKYKDMDASDIKAQWATSGAKASARGTFFHELLENDMNGYALPASPYQRLVPVRQYLRWKDQHFTGQYEPYRTEFRMVTNEQTRVTGTADLLAVNLQSFHALAPDDDTLPLTLMDWKFSKGIKWSNTFENGSGPCHLLPNCNGYHYQIQQNMYASIIEAYPGPWTFRGRTFQAVSIEAMFLVVFSEGAEHAQQVLLERDTSLVERMLKTRHGVKDADAPC